MRNEQKATVGALSFLLTILLIASLLPRAARANVIFFSGNPNGYQAALNGLGIEQQNVMFNDAGLTLTGATVQGVVNNSDFQLVDISSNELLIAAGGQAPQVAAQDGALRLASISPSANNDDAHSVFRSLAFTLANANNLNGTVMVHVFDAVGNPIYAFDVTYGLDFVGVLTTGETNFASIQLSSNFDNSAIQQLRVAFAHGQDFDEGDQPATQSHPVLTPEPTSIAEWSLLALIGTGNGWRTMRSRGKSSVVETQSAAARA